LWVRITVAGHTDQHNDVEALIDTGFTGELLLPLRLAVPLGLRLVGVSRVQLADGSISQQMLFSASIGWGSVLREVTVNVVDGTDVPLIGGGLLDGYVLHVNFEQKQLTIKEPHTDEPSPPGVSETQST